MRPELAGLLRSLAVAAAVAWIAVPLGVTILFGLTPAEDYYSDRLVPRSLTLEHIRLFIALGAWDAIVNSVVVASLTVALSFLLGLPAGYALARYIFPGRDLVKLGLVALRMFPIIVIGVPLTVLYIRLNLSDTLIGVALAHTSMALPFVVLITSSIFAGVPRDLEEAGLVFGLDPRGVFLRITLPLVLPGLAAAAMFAFIMSWNEVFVASVLTLTRRTLPAFILSQVEVAADPFKFAAVLVMTAPSMVFVFLARRYLVTLWGITLK